MLYCSKIPLLCQRTPQVCDFRQAEKKSAWMLKEEEIFVTKSEKKVHGDILYETILSLRDLDECKRFLQDLCTMAELKAMEQRFEVALMLDEGMIYNDILGRTGASSATVSRVNRALHYGTGGYPQVLPRVRPLWEKEKEKMAK